MQECDRRKQPLSSKAGGSFKIYASESRMRNEFRLAIRNSSAEMTSRFAINLLLLHYQSK